MVHYASVVQKLQKELADAGIVERQTLAKFPHLDIDEAVTNLPADNITGEIQ